MPSSFVNCSLVYLFFIFVMVFSCNRMFANLNFSFITILEPKPGIDKNQNKN